MSDRSRFTRGRRVQRGISRFEAKLGVLVGALTVTGVVFATSRADDDQRQRVSEQAASKILSAATRFAKESGSGCPTISSLMEDDLLAKDTQLSDAWGERFRVECDSGFSVHSAGADGKLDSDDDVHVSDNQS